MLEGGQMMAKKYIEETNIEYLPDTQGNRKVLKEIAAYDAMWEQLLKTHFESGE